MSNDEFIITPREDKTVTMSIRIERVLQEQLDELAVKAIAPETRLLIWPWNTPSKM